MIIKVPGDFESIVDIQNVQGFSGIITGIAAVNGIEWSSTSTPLN